MMERDMKYLVAVALMLAATSSLGWAQSAEDDEKHHPQQQETAPAPAGMMGDGMMKMMGVMPMADMMQMMMGMMRPSGAGMETIDHVEGHIAFLRTELKITDAQSNAWNTSPMLCAPTPRPWASCAPR
jgi:hypothetical protein